LSFSAKFFPDSNKKPSLLEHRSFLYRVCTLSE
jgi:hypothetical protein